MVSTLFLSRPCSYAIRALTYLAMQPPGKLCGTREISGHEGIPNSFLCKVLLQLRRGRLLRSYKGIGGGYELAAPPDKISLLMIVQCMEGEGTLQQCILEEHECSAPRLCPLHHSWASVHDQLMRFLEGNTLVELVRVRQSEAWEGAKEPGSESVRPLTDQ